MSSYKGNIPSVKTSLRSTIHQTAFKRPHEQSASAAAQRTTITAGRHIARRHGMSPCTTHAHFQLENTLFLLASQPSSSTHAFPNADNTIPPQQNTTRMGANLVDSIPRLIPLMSMSPSLPLCRETQQARILHHTPPCGLACHARPTRTVASSEPHTVQPPLWCCARTDFCWGPRELVSHSSPVSPQPAPKIQLHPSLRRLRTYRRAVAHPNTQRGSLNFGADFRHRLTVT